MSSPTNKMAWDRKISSGLALTPHTHWPCSDFQRQKYVFWSTFLSEVNSTRSAVQRNRAEPSHFFSFIWVKCRQWPGHWKKCFYAGLERRCLTWKAVSLTAWGQNSITLLLKHITVTTWLGEQAFEKSSCCLQLSDLLQLLIPPLEGADHYFCLFFLDLLVPISRSEVLFKAVLP